MQLKQAIRVLAGKVSIGYFNGQLYKLTSHRGSKANLEIASCDFNPKILIVSRKHYQEKLITYPVVNPREIKRLMALNNTLDKAENVVHYCINSVTDNHSKVNTWQFSTSVPDAFICLPETMLISKVASQNQPLTIENELKQPCLYMVITSQGLFSACPTAILNNVSRFSQSCGISLKEEEIRIADTNLAQVLFDGLVKLSLNEWRVFWSRSVVKLPSKDLKRPAAACVAVVAFYLLLSSGYIFWQQQLLDNDQSIGKADVVTAIEIQGSIRELSRKITTLSSVVNRFNQSSGIWQVLLPLYSQAEFSHVLYAEKRFLIRGQTDKASELLALLANIKGVSDAKFDLPVSISRQKERFSISFLWQQPSIQKNADVSSQ